MIARTVARACAVVGATALAAAGVLLAPAASAAPPGVEVDYNTTGSTTLTNPNSLVTVTFKPTVLQSFITFNSNNTGTVQAFLPLAPVSASFKAFGFLPARGTVSFTQVGPETGKIGLSTSNGIPLRVDATYVVSLSNVFIGGRNAHVGTNCQTIDPIHASVHAKPGFDLTTGDLVGTYDLGEFINCGGAQDIINDTLPGTRNALAFHIQFGDPSSSRARAAIARAQGHSVSSR